MQNKVAFSVIDRYGEHRKPHENSSTSDEDDNGSAARSIAMNKFFSNAQAVCAAKSKIMDALLIA